VQKNAEIHGVGDLIDQRRRKPMRLGMDQKNEANFLWMKE